MDTHTCTLKVKMYMYMYIGSTPGEFSLDSANINLCDFAFSYLHLQLLGLADGLSKHQKSRGQPIKAMDS